MGVALGLSAKEVTYTDSAWEQGAEETICTYGS
jgi:hypothetical protein